MRAFTSFLAFVATLLLLAACGGNHREEAVDVYEDGYLLNDNMVAYRSDDGTVTFKNTETNQETISGNDLDWTQTSPHDSLAVFCTDNKRGYYNVFTGEIAVPFAAYSVPFAVPAAGISRTNSFSPSALYTYLTVSPAAVVYSSGRFSRL